MRLIFLVTFSLIALSLPLAAQEASAGAETDAITGEAAPATDVATDENAATDTTSARKNHTFFVSIGPTLVINTDASTKSAPSPVSFSGGVGGTLFQNAPVSFEPRLTFFTNYYLWDGEAAHPAEVENRTATVLSFLVDMDTVKIFRRGKNEFHIGGGVSVLARVAMLSGGVDSDDAGGTDTSTAGDDVSSISSYFWSDLRFLYPNITGCWLYALPNGWKAGASASVYVPLGSLMHGDGVDGMLVSLAFRIAI